MGNVKTSGSLRLRLIAMLIITGAVMALLLVWVFQSFARQIATEAQDSQLHASATSILESASLDNGELLIDIPYSALSMLGFVSEDRVFYHIALNNEFLSGYEKLVSLPIGAETQFRESEHLGVAVRLVSASRLIGAGENSSVLWVSVAQTQDGINARLSIISRRAIIIGAGFFLLASMLSLFVSYRAFRPMERLAQSVARRGPKDLTPIQQIVPDEMGELVGSLNDFTSRLRRALTSSEDFITEAAHRIRTPLATVRTQAELIIRRSKSSENRKSMRSLLRAVDETSRTSSQLLDHALVNLRSDALERKELQIGAFIEEIIDRIHPIAELRDIQIAFDNGYDTKIMADDVLLERAISNLIDNSLKYAPEESQIVIATRNQNEQLNIFISDSGQGFPDEANDELFERFKRGQDSNSIIGSGLGLTIAQDAVIAHGGKITLTNKIEGGACAIISLPC